jgi:TRAP-type C4-dicarboxylate transport system substrate-binding protein
VKPIELKLNFLWPSEAQQVKGAYQPWINEIEKRSNGKVKITPYYLNSLAPIQEAYNAAITGIADISELDLQMHPGLFSMHDIIYYTPPSAKYARWCRITKTLENEFPQMMNELSKVKLLFSWSMGSNHVESIKPVRKLEDAPGVKLGGMGDKIPRFGQAMGFATESIPPFEAYTSVEKRVLDGVMMTSDCLVSWRMADVVKYHSYISIAGTLFIVVMNKEKWNSLPTDIKNVFDEVSSKWVPDYFDQYFSGIEKSSIAQGVSKGVEAIELSPAELARWDIKTKGLIDEYIKTMEDKKLPGKKLYNRWMELVAREKM